MTEVKNANSNQDNDKKFYSGGEDIQQLNNQSNWQKDFKVMAGQVITFTQDVWDRIVELLTGESANNPEAIPDAQNKSNEQNVQPKNDSKACIENPDENVDTPANNPKATPENTSAIDIMLEINPQLRNNKFIQLMNSGNRSDVAIDAVETKMSGNSDIQAGDDVSPGTPAAVSTVNSSGINGTPDAETYQIGDVEFTDKGYTLPSGYHVDLLPMKVKFVDKSRVYVDEQDRYN